MATATLSPCTAAPSCSSSSRRIAPSVSTCTRALARVRAGGACASQAVGALAAGTSDCASPRQPEKRAMASSLASSVRTAPPEKRTATFDQALCVIEWIGGADERRESVRAIVGDDDLAVIALEVELTRQRAGCARRSAPPVQRQPPRTRVQEVRVAQCIQVGRHHLDARRAQQLQLARPGRSRNARSPDR